MLLQQVLVAAFPPLRPVLRVQIRVARWTVDRRCAMTRVVRSCISCFQGGLHGPLDFGVQGARGLVQDQDGRVLEQGPGDGDALPLAARTREAPVLGRCRGVVALRQCHDELVGVGLLRGRLHRGAAASRP